jgi:hypothetical protein
VVVQNTPSKRGNEPRTGLGSGDGLSHQSNQEVQELGRGVWAERLGQQRGDLLCAMPNTRTSSVEACGGGPPPGNVWAAASQALCDFWVAHERGTSTNPPTVQLETDLCHAKDKSEVAGDALLLENFGRLDPLPSCCQLDQNTRPALTNFGFLV